MWDKRVLKLAAAWPYSSSIYNKTIIRRQRPDDHMGSLCGSVGRVVASDIRNPRIKSQHRQNITYQIYIWIEKTKNKIKWGQELPIFEKDHLTTHLPWRLLLRRERQGHWHRLRWRSAPWRCPGCRGWSRWWWSSRPWRRSTEKSRWWQPWKNKSWPKRWNGCDD